MFVLLALVLSVDAAPPTSPAVTRSIPGTLRSAKDILADYAKAIGDEAAWSNHRSVRVKRDVSVKAMRFRSTEETRVARGGKIFSVSEMPNMGTFRRGSDGQIAWSEDPISGLRTLSGGEAEDIRIAAMWNPEWHLSEIYSKITSVVAPEVIPPGQAWECVELAKSKGKPSTLCFDRTTHLRVWEKGVQSSQGGDVPYVTKFSDWRVVEGVKVWYQEEVSVGPMTMEGKIVEVVFDEKIPPRLFELPQKQRK